MVAKINDFTQITSLINDLGLVDIEYFDHPTNITCNFICGFRISGCLYIEGDRRDITIYEGGRCIFTADLTAFAASRLSVWLHTKDLEFQKRKARVSARLSEIRTCNK